MVLYELQKQLGRGRFLVMMLITPLRVYQGNRNI